MTKTDRDLSELVAKRDQGGILRRLMWILRHRRRFAPRCLRTCHSPSPSVSKPVLSIYRLGGPCEPRREWSRTRAYGAGPMC